MKNMEQIESVTIRAGDVIVLSCVGSVSHEAAEKIKSKAQEVFGKDHQILVLSDGLKISIINKEPAA